MEKDYIQKKKRDQDLEEFFGGGFTAVINENGKAPNFSLGHKGTRSLGGQKEEKGRV